MAYRSAEEFVSMYRKNPERAKQLLDKALAQGKNPISEKNAGYGSSAYARRARRYKNKGTTDGAGFLPGEGNPVPGPNKRPSFTKYKRRRRTPVPGPRYPTTR